MKKSDMCSLITHLGKKSTLSPPYFSSPLSFFSFLSFVYIHRHTNAHSHTSFFFFFCLILRFFYNEPEFLNDEFIYIDTNNNGNGKKNLRSTKTKHSFSKWVSNWFQENLLICIVLSLFDIYFRSKPFFSSSSSYIYICIYMDLIYNKALLFVYLFFSIDWIVLSFFVNFLFSGFWNK